MEKAAGLGKTQGSKAGNTFHLSGGCVCLHVVTEDENGLKSQHTKTQNNKNAACTQSWLSVCASTRQTITRAVSVLWPHQQSDAGMCFSAVLASAMSRLPSGASLEFSQSWCWGGLD